MNACKTLLISFCLLACAPAAHAYQRRMPSRFDFRTGLMAYGVLNFRNVNPRGINETLVRNGFPEMYVPGAVSGGGITVWFNRLGITLEGTKASSLQEHTGSAADGSLTFSYTINDLDETKYFAVYPFAGFREVFYEYGSGYTKSGSEKSFSGLSPYFDFGIGGDFGALAMVGLRIGYLVPFVQTRWTDNTSPRLITNGQVVNRGIYVSLRLGLGLLPGIYGGD